MTKDPQFPGTRFNDDKISHFYRIWLTVYNLILITLSLVNLVNLWVLGPNPLNQLFWSKMATFGKSVQQTMNSDDKNIN